MSSHVILNPVTKWKQQSNKTHLKTILVSLAKLQEASCSGSFCSTAQNRDLEEILNIELWFAHVTSNGS